MSGIVGLLTGRSVFVTGIEPFGNALKVYVTGRYNRRYFLVETEDDKRGCRMGPKHTIIDRDHIPYVLEERDEGPDRLVLV